MSLNFSFLALTYSVGLNRVLDPIELIELNELAGDIPLLKDGDTPLVSAGDTTRFEFLIDLSNELLRHRFLFKLFCDADSY